MKVLQKLHNQISTMQSMENSNIEKDISESSIKSLQSDIEISQHHEVRFLNLVRNILFLKCNINKNNVLEKSYEL